MFSNASSSQHGLPSHGADWFLDSGASSRVTNNAGNLSLSRFFSWHNSPSIIVGNGQRLPITATGSTALSLSNLALNDVLVCPSIVKNLISVCKLSTDNNISVKFNPRGFSMKDLATKNIIMKSSSSSDLYPLSGNKASSSVTFSTTTGDLWHRRLGHPGRASLDSIFKNFLPDCTNNSRHVCTACQLGR